MAWCHSAVALGEALLVGLCRESGRGGYLLGDAGAALLLLRGHGDRPNAGRVGSRLKDLPRFSCPLRVVNRLAA